MADRIKEIETFMKTNRKDYFKDEKMQQDRDLLDAQEHLESRTRAA